MHAPGTPTQSRGASSISSPSASASTATASNASLAAALKGATLAFQGQNNKSASTSNERPTPTSPNPPPTHRTDNEALRAATQAARDRPLSRPRSPTGYAGNTNRPDLSRHGTGGSMPQDQRSHSLEPGQVAHRLSQHLLPPAASHAPQTGIDTRPSASYIAATLAASRSGSPSPTPGQGAGFAQAPMSAAQLHSRVTRRPSLGASGLVSSGATGDHMPDTESIQPTGSLISLFEGKESVDVDPVKKREAASERTQSKARLPTPPRSGSPEAEERGQIMGAEPRKAPRTKPKPPPSVVVRAATFKEADDAGGRQARKSLSPSPRSSSGADIGEQHHAERSQVSTESNAAVRRGSQAKTGKPPVAPRQPKSVPNPDTLTGRRPLTPPLLETRPVTELISPEPRRIIKTPRLDPPRLPPRTTARSETDLARLTDRRGSARRTHSQSSASSDDTFVSASSTQSPRVGSPVKELELAVVHHDAGTPLSRQPSPRTGGQRSPIPRHPSSSPTSRPAMPSRRPTAPNASSNSSLALDSLANAIVASNLASTRLATMHSSPGPPPLPAPRRQNRPRSPQHLQPQRTAESLLSPNRTGGSSKSPSGRNHETKQAPRTGMLQTLRAPPSSLSDDEDARRRMHRTRKKPMHPLSGGKKHAHNEGARRRWRDEVSVRERRRYEAVWASNRGLFLRPSWGFTGEDDAGRAGEGSEAADLVANVVVRDIWSRSRLPEDELAEVWALVDRRGDGTLGRMEFVVGMWLVDQRLRGRKIPARVGESVWASVRGVVVPEPRKR